MPTGFVSTLLSDQNNKTQPDGQCLSRDELIHLLVRVKQSLSRGKIIMSAEILGDTKPLCFIKQ